MFGRRRRDEPAPEGFQAFVRDRVIAHTVDRQSFRGFVARDQGGVLVLEHAERLTSAPGDVALEARVTPVGTIAIEHRNLSVVQILAAVPDEPLELAPAAGGRGIPDRIVPLVSEVAS